MKTSLLFILTFLSIAFGKDVIAVFGPSGSGKSELIKNVFDNPNPITGMVNSVTMKATKYECGPNAKDIFGNCSVIDTRGHVGDTTGSNTEEILSETETAFFQERELSKKPLKATMFIENYHPTRVHLRENLAYIQTVFSSTIYNSAVVVYNKFPEIPDSKHQWFVNQLKDVCHSIQILNQLPSPIPIVVIDAKHPTRDQIEQLKKAISRVQPYNFKDMDKKREEIEKIFQDMINDPKNKKDIVDKIVENKTVTVNKTVLARVVKMVTETQVGQSSFGFLGFKMSTPKTIHTQKAVEVDEERVVTDVEVRPEVVETVRQVLKNEEDVFWKMAAQKYFQDVFDKNFKNSKR